MARLEALVAQLQRLDNRRQATELQLERIASELERSNQELEQFAYAASHDLQEPLRMVATFTELLAERLAGELDAEGREIMGFIVDGATRMRSLIENLLAYSRVSRRGKTFCETDLNFVMSQVISNLQLAIEESGADILSDELPSVVADSAQMLQLFQNLLANATKFRSSEPLVVHVGVVQKGDDWEFSVSDNGIGIGEEFRERVFAIFQRLHTRQEYPGTGVGLAICKRIVERHGGSIWLESSVEGGALFKFTIPVEGAGSDEHTV